jgi:hypothetical protein
MFKGGWEKACGAVDLIKPRQNNADEPLVVTASNHRYPQRGKISSKQGSRRKEQELVLSGHNKRLSWRARRTMSRSRANRGFCSASIGD